MKNRIIILALFLLNCVHSFSQLPVSITDSSNAVNQIRKVLNNYTATNNSYIIKLLRNSFKRVGFSDGYNNLSKSNIIIIPKMEIDTSNRSEYNKEPLFRVNMNLNKNQFEGIVIYEDSIGNLLQIQIRKITAHQQKMVFNRFNDKEPVKFSLQMGEYSIIGKKLNALQKFIIASNYLRNMHLFCLVGVSSSDGYKLGGWDVYPYIVLKNEVYEATFLLLDEVNSNIEDSQELDRLELDKYKLSNSLKKYTR